MNSFDDIDIDRGSFAFTDLTGQDKWVVWVPAFGSLTVVGATAYLGRYRVNGRQVDFQITLSAATSIASVAGTDYLTLPIQAKGLAGFAVMTDASSKIAVGVCHLDVPSSRVYLPTQAASGHLFSICGSYER